MVLRVGAWRKSTYSGQEGACLEASWRKSTYSEQEGACVETALDRAEVLVRDSKDPALPVQQHPAAAWRAFLNHLVRLA
ncbi:DUF397 domain-containing protein [Amycolatopsis sp. Hca4]|uniref:DUF397 domain-containing protein n=1 Tax=unclassified Amycolatopsis TaxID=2618356 RepID=UPI0015929D0B|nr:DUF397 domain-containing protein [Amycolatopsis sp. Hca4]QKV76934.1 DUF397 domain-containing protein [Amycolatopsis sp. Hca4]